MTASVSTPFQTDLSLPTVATCLARHVALYRHRSPVYQAELLRSIRQLWQPGERRVLDVGGGTGLIGQAIKDLFEVDAVTAVDVQDRFLKSLSIETRTYDGETLPFPAGSFDCVVLSNVLHHVPVVVRVPLMHEIRRVVGGGRVYIKDHHADSGLDHIRLFVLDAMGNIPFGGMVKASYLTGADWASLAAKSGFHIEAIASPRTYRQGVFAALFPNRLETTMVWRAATGS
jgi:SAM-dependent methyltransferase